MHWTGNVAQVEALSSSPLYCQKTKQNNTKNPKTKTEDTPMLRFFLACVMARSCKSHAGRGQSQLKIQ